MFVGVVVENFHRCRAEQEKEERARRAAKRAKKIEERRRSKIYSFLKIQQIYGFRRMSDSSLITFISSSWGFIIVNLQTCLLIDIGNEK